MKPITRLMINEFKLKEFDFMGYKLIKSQATYHHIIKKEHGGKETLENGAVLMPIPHTYLHIIEFKDIKIFDAINTIFRVINESGKAPTKEQLEIISCLLRMFEKEHIGDRTSNKKLLIKREYLDRYYYGKEYKAGKV